MQANNNPTRSGIVSNSGDLSGKHIGRSDGHLA